MPEMSPPKAWRLIGAGGITGGVNQPLKQQPSV